MSATTAVWCRREGCEHPKIRYYAHSSVWRHIDPDYGQPVALDHNPEPDERPGRMVAGVWVADEDAERFDQEAAARARAEQFTPQCFVCESPFHDADYHDAERNYDPVTDMVDDDGGTDPRPSR